ncbi:Asp23/Gls24 family envelope stress response protein [Vallicoccus soli]|uniref:Asp23/Gls24 family envelope stress response protein n=1 Tax=Vallicoccus soli TaxID=2339232 RepID=A0A3A3YU08_9ACTN|nr:Asp23/Gls24 family envelope stress response protein [Vallicoccus soli]RJK94945.1 Asp23/Gls24 family envelope stress response protein [Vallicoccus soli]
MTAAAPARATWAGPVPPPPAQPLPTPPAERGRLTVAPRVVERVAAAAAARVPGAGGVRHGVLGALGGLGGDAADPRTADVGARVDGDVAVVSLALSVRWPEDVRRVVAAVREAVRTEVARTCAVRVLRVDVEVLRLDASVPDRPRVR